MPFEGRKPKQIIAKKLTHFHAFGSKYVQINSRRIEENKRNMVFSQSGIQLRNMMQDGLVCLGEDTCSQEHLQKMHNISINPTRAKSSRVVYARDNV